AVKPQLTAGPGVMSKALALHKQYDALSLCAEDSLFWIEDAVDLIPDQMVATPRIGIDYAEESIDWPWRFYINGNRWVSKRRK
ncbi:MAG: DNA-3-methyladenine glycosylase, partial [Bacteroidota bacterium]